MTFLGLENTHNHTFEAFAANTAEPWLHLMTKNTLRIPDRVVDEIFGANSLATVLLMRWSQGQTSGYDETSAIAVSYSRVDQNGLTRVSVPYIASRKRHPEGCMGFFLDHIETTNRAVGETVLTITAGNLRAQTFLSRGYDEAPGSPLAFRLSLPASDQPQLDT